MRVTVEVQVAVEAADGMGQLHGIVHVVVAVVVRDEDQCVIEACRD